MDQKIIDFVTEVATAIVNKASESDVRASRARFWGRTGHYNFAWIMVEQCDVTVNGSDTKVPGLYARTNDMDLMVGYPPSFSESCTLDSTGELIDKIVAYVTEKFANQSGLDLLLQTDFRSNQHMPNYVGSSDDGFAAIHEQVDIDGI